MIYLERNNKVFRDPERVLERLEEYNEDFTRPRLPAASNLGE